MSTTTMAWQELVEYSQNHDLLAKQLYVVFSRPTQGLGPVLENLDQHIGYQTDLENRGIMFAAGPFASPDEQSWNGEGMFMYRAGSRHEAVDLADADPMHKAGARSYDVRLWMMNEGTMSVSLYFSGGKPVVQ